MRYIFILLSVAASVLAAPYSSVTFMGEPSEVSRKNNTVPSNYYQGFEDTLQDSISPKQQHLPQYSENSDDNLDLPPYKKLEPKQYTVIVPSLPNEQAELNEKKNMTFDDATDRRYKKLMALIREARKQVNVSDGVLQKQVVGTDLNGHLRYIEIPYYNRGSR